MTDPELGDDLESTTEMPAPPAGHGHVLTADDLDATVVIAPIDWEQDWSRASAEDLAKAVSALANATGGVEQPMLEEAAEQLWRLADLEH